MKMFLLHIESAASFLNWHKSCLQGMVDRKRQRVLPLLQKMFQVDIILLLLMQEHKKFLRYTLYSCFFGVGCFLPRKFLLDKELVLMKR
jgi:hypothetical protein